MLYTIFPSGNLGSMHLVPPKNLINSISQSAKANRFIANSRKTIQDIFDRQDPRLLIIVGPCSIHNVDEALEYARELKKLAKDVEESSFLVMRAYIEKPRTRKGWQGLIHDPHLNGSHDIATGLVLARTFLKELAEMGVPSATEFLTPHLSPYIEDLISWGSIGARTVSSQVHRFLASHLPMPVGFKNTVDGNVDCAINGVHVARSPHSFLHICEEGKLRQMKSVGNPYAHVVLRGSTNNTNYDKNSIQETLNHLRALEIPPRVLIDCSHGNCQRQYFQQKQVFHNVLEQIQKGNQQILGMMIESNLEAGSQAIPSQLDELQPGVSITDPCLDFSMTAALVSSISSAEMSLTQS